MGSGVNNVNPNSYQQRHGKYLSMFGHGYDGDEDSSSDDSDGSEIRRSIGIRHFPFVSAMRQYCLTESRLYEFFLAFENLAIDQVFGDINIIFGKTKKKKNNSNSNKLNPISEQKEKNGTTSSYKHRSYQSSVDFGDYIPSISGLNGDSSKLPHYEYISMFEYNYNILENTSS